VQRIEARRKGGREFKPLALGWLLRMPKLPPLFLGKAGRRQLFPLWGEIVEMDHV
jgi:hypothetical protein